MRAIPIGRHVIGAGQRCFVIAEAGVNHNGDPELALALVDAAHRAGADCIKFQTFSADRVATADAPKAPYQNRTTEPGESQLDMIRRLELPLDAYPALLRRCQELDLEFLSTPANVEDIEYLETLGVAAYKIASFQIAEPNFLRHVAGTGKPVLLSTGMADLGEVERAVRVVQATGNDRLVLLQCTTSYPSTARDANLRAMRTLGDAFGTVVGYSDHVDGDACCLAAVALGASVIEKHLTLDRAMHGPDHAASADPQEFTRLVSQIRDVEAALGSGIKSPTATELDNRPFMRRSVTTRVPITAGSRIDASMLTVKRPGTGISAADFDSVVGTSARHDLPANRVVQWTDLVR
ncbi:MAG: N-acetylneuraminate synthase [Vicinamibacterales bacterium]